MKPNGGGQYTMLISNPTKTHQDKATVDEALNAEVRVNTIWSQKRTLATVKAAMLRYPLETTRIYAEINRKEHGKRVEKRKSYGFFSGELNSFLAKKIQGETS